MERRGGRYIQLETWKSSSGKQDLCIRRGGDKKDDHPKTPSNHSHKNISPRLEEFNLGADNQFSLRVFVAGCKGGK